MDIPLETGELTFTLVRAGKTDRWSVDMITAKLGAEELETRHGLQQSGNHLIATAAFLEDLATYYQSLRADGCTPTVARQVWIFVATEFLRLSDRNADAIEAMLA